MSRSNRQDHDRASRRRSWRRELNVSGIWRTITHVGMGAFTYRMEELANTHPNATAFSLTCEPTLPYRRLRSMKESECRYQETNLLQNLTFLPSFLSLFEFAAFLINVNMKGHWIDTSSLTKSARVSLIANAWKAFSTSGESSLSGNPKMGAMGLT